MTETPDPREDADCPGPEWCDRTCDQHPTRGAPMTDATDDALEYVGDLLTPSHVGTPEFYIVEADNLSQLVERIEQLGAERGWDMCLAAVTAGVVSAKNAHAERGHRQIVSALVGLEQAIPRTENPYRRGGGPVNAPCPYSGRPILDCKVSDLCDCFEFPEAEERADQIIRDRDARYQSAPEENA